MADLIETLEICTDKALKVVKSVDKIINGSEKQLVLEVGSHTTKIVEYVVNSKNIEVTGGAVLNTPANSIKNDRLIDIDTLSRVLSEALVQEKIKTKEFVVSIVSKEIITREMDVPQMREKELKSFVQINSDDIFPVKLSDYVLAYNIIEKGAKNRVMIAAIPKDIVSLYILLGEKLGLNLKGICYSGYELYNFLDFEIDNYNETYLAVDIGAKNSNIVIISNGSLKYNKILPKGSEEISVAISEELTCPLAKAEQLKRQYNTIEESDNQDGDAQEEIVIKYTQRFINNIMSDILRIIEFYNTNNVKNKISKIYLIGTVGKIKGIEEFVSKKINVKTVALKNLNKVIYNKSALKLKTRQQNFMNCLGAHELKGRKFYIIKGDLNLTKQSLVLKPKFHKIGVCILLLMFVVLLLGISSVQEIENNLAFYNNYIEENGGLISLQREITSKNAEIEDQKKKLDSLGLGLESYSNVVLEIDKALKNVELDAKLHVIKCRFQRNTIEVMVQVNLPVGIDESHPDYLQYRNLPFNLEETVEKNIEHDVKVTSDSLDVFTFKIEV